MEHHVAPQTLLGSRDLMCGGAQIQSRLGEPRLYILDTSIVRRHAVPSLRAAPCPEAKPLAGGAAQNRNVCIRARQRRPQCPAELHKPADRKSTRLNSSHLGIS